jgi:hypothetical protein
VVTLYHISRNIADCVEIHDKPGKIKNHIMECDRPVHPF